MVRIRSVRCGSRLLPRRDSERRRIDLGVAGSVRTRHALHEQQPVGTEAYLVDPCRAQRRANRPPVSGGRAASQIAEREVRSERSVVGPHRLISQPAAQRKDQPSGDSFECGPVVVYRHDEDSRAARVWERGYLVKREVGRLRRKLRRVVHRRLDIAGKRRGRVAQEVQRQMVVFCRDPPYGASAHLRFQLCTRPMDLVDNRLRRTDPDE